MPSHHDLIQELAAQFRQAWSPHSRPDFAEFLGKISVVHQPALARELVSNDIALRRAAGEDPQPSDYAAGDPTVFSQAGSLLENEPTIRVSDSHFAPQESFSLDPTGVSQEARTVKDDESFTAPMQVIGPYRLLRQIGSGGMGTVWIADQQEPVQRRVALKLIRADLDSQGTMARFEAERQAIALMDHQNIAKILDAGTTDTNRPYFVMELVDGVRLDKFCDDNRLGVRERLELMIPICRAIQHAHQKGIIHRDLKHSNVLVAMSDGVPIPKVIDFGLAKALGNRGKNSDESMLTKYGQVVGTLRYMSPEQARGRDVDTRSDIYSLGVMLYKLLTGSTPILDEPESNESFARVLDNICVQDPPRPSSRISYRDESSTSISECRGEKPERLRQILKGDLDWIVMKALEKDRDRRYETANGLALDLERFLNDDEVAARPPSNIYRLRKFVKRNRGLVTSLALVLGLLVLGVLGTSSALVWALKERNRANLNSNTAQREADNARTAEANAKESEQRRRKLQTTAEAQLHAIRLKSAWSDWQMGNAEAAMRMLKTVSDSAGWESQFLAAEFASNKNVLFGHARQVIAVDVSPNGNWIATAGTDHTLRIWNAHTRSLVRTEVLPGAASGVCFAANGSWVACSDRSNHVTLLEIRQANGATPAIRLGPYPRDIMSIAFSATDEELILGEAERNSYREGIGWKYDAPAPPRILIVNRLDGKVLTELTGHTKAVTTVAALSDGAIVSGSRDFTIRIWRKLSAEETEEDKWDSQVLTGHGGEVNSVAVFGDERLVSGSGDKSIRVWELPTGRLLHTLIGHTDTVSAVDISPDGTQIASAAHDRTARIWRMPDASAQNELSSQAPPANSGHDPLDSKQSSQAPEAEPELQFEQLVCRGHYGAVNAVCFSADQQSIITAADDQTARIWNASSRPSSLNARAHRDIVWSADFSIDGKKIVSASEDGTLTIVNADTGEVLSKTNEQTPLLSVDYSPFSRYIAFGGADNRVRIRSGHDGSLLQVLDGHEGYVWDVSFSPDGKYLASSSSDKSVRIWETEQWTVTHELRGHEGELASARFSSDGRFLVTASDDTTLKLWDATNFELIDTLQGHKNTVWKAIFSPSSQMIASSSYDGEVILWDVETRKMKRRIAAHNNQVAGLAFTSDSSRVITASDDATIKIWDVESGIDLFVLRDPGDTAIVHVSFSADGRQLVSGNAAGWVTVRSAVDDGTIKDTFLPEDAVKLCTNGLMAVLAEEANEGDFRRELNHAIQCCATFPSYRAWTIRGIAEYRLNQVDRSVQSLSEALRLEPIEYGEPDVRPLIEGFLAMALHKIGQSKESQELRQVFETKRASQFWREDTIVLRLADELQSLLGNTD